MDEIQDVNYDKTDVVNLSAAKASISVRDQFTAVQAYLKVAECQERIDLQLVHCFLSYVLVIEPSVGPIKASNRYSVLF